MAVCNAHEEQAEAVEILLDGGAQLEIRNAVGSMQKAIQQRGVVAPAHQTLTCVCACVRVHVCVYGRGCGCGCGCVWLRVVACGEMSAGW